MIDLARISHCHEAGAQIATQELSEMDSIRGAYCEVGSVELGAPRPDMPETLCLLVPEGEACGRAGGGSAPLMD